MARWIIHAVGPVWRDGAEGEPALPASAYRRSLSVASEIGVRFDAPTLTIDEQELAVCG